MTRAIRVKRHLRERPSNASDTNQAPPIAATACQGSSQRPKLRLSAAREVSSRELESERHVSVYDCVFQPTVTVKGFVTGKSFVFNTRSGTEQQGAELPCPASPVPASRALTHRPPKRNRKRRRCWAGRAGPGRAGPAKGSRRFAEGPRPRCSPGPGAAPAAARGSPGGWAPPWQRAPGTSGSST